MPVSQGGKQESLSNTSSKYRVETEYHEAVADLVQLEALETPLSKKTEICRWVDNNGAVGFSNQRRGNLEEQMRVGSDNETGVPKETTLECQRAMQLPSAESQSKQAIQNARHPVITG